MTNEKDELTVEKLKEYKGFENISDDEAREQLRAMDIIITLAFKSFQSNIKKKGIE